MEESKPIQQTGNESNKVDNQAISDRRENVYSSDAYAQQVPIEGDVTTFEEDPRLEDPEDTNDREQSHPSTPVQRFSTQEKGKWVMKSNDVITEGGVPSCTYPSKEELLLTSGVKIEIPIIIHDANGNPVGLERAEKSVWYPTKPAIKYVQRKPKHEPKILQKPMVPAIRRLPCIPPLPKNTRTTPQCFFAFLYFITQVKWHPQTVKAKMPFFKEVELRLRYPYKIRHMSNKKTFMDCFLDLMVNVAEHLWIEERYGEWSYPEKADIFDGAYSKFTDVTIPFIGWNKREDLENIACQRLFLDKTEPQDLAIDRYRADKGEAPIKTSYRQRILLQMCSEPEKLFERLSELQGEVEAEVEKIEKEFREQAKVKYMGDEEVKDRNTDIDVDAMSDQEFIEYHTYRIPARTEPFKKMPLSIPDFTPIRTKKHRKAPVPPSARPRNIKAMREEAALAQARKLAEESKAEASDHEVLSPKLPNTTLPETPLKSISLQVTDPVLESPKTSRITTPALISLKLTPPKTPSATTTPADASATQSSTKRRLKIKFNLHSKNHQSPVLPGSGKTTPTSKKRKKKTSEEDDNNEFDDFINDDDSEAENNTPSKRHRLQKGRRSI